MGDAARTIPLIRDPSHWLRLLGDAVGAPTQRKALMLLQGILRRAVVRGLIPINPAPLVDKPKQRPTGLPQPLSPVTVERIRAVMLQPRTRFVPAAGRGKRQRRAHETSIGTPRERQRNALIVSMLAYAGLRPIEDHGDDELVVPRPSGGRWTREDWANWRRRVWRPAAIEAGVTGDLRPYRLRGSFVSLLLWEGHSLTYVAEQAGHSIATLARHYAGTMRELETAPRIPAAEAVQQPRREVCGTH